MIRRLVITLGMTLSVFCSQGSAAAGRLFHVTPLGESTICIKTTTPDWFYQFAGIKVITPGYTIQSFTDTEGLGFGHPSPREQCTVSDNGYCLFSTNDKQAIPIVVTGAPGAVEFTLCLNGVGATYSCENHLITFQQPALTSSSPRGGIGCNYFLS